MRSCGRCHFSLKIVQKEPDVEKCVLSLLIVGLLLLLVGCGRQNDQKKVSFLNKTEREILSELLDCPAPNRDWKAEWELQKKDMSKVSQFEIECDNLNLWLSANNPQCEEPENCKRSFKLYSSYKEALEAGVNAEIERLRSEVRRVAADPWTWESESLYRILLENEWDGDFEDWFISLFGDDNFSGEWIYLLRIPVQKDPDRRIPIVKRLLGHENRVIHCNAAYCLAGIARKDALLPLLPWIADPEWAGRSGRYGRLVYLKNLSKVDLPESLPLLKRRLTEESLLWDERRSIIDTLLVHNTLSDEELVNYIEQFARQSDGKGNYSKLKGAAACTGEVLTVLDRVSHVLASKIHARAQAIKKTEPLVAAALLSIKKSWPTMQDEHRVVDKFVKGTIDTDLVDWVLTERGRLCESSREAFRKMVVRGGIYAGIAASVLDDERLMRQLLESEDLATKLAVLACARFNRQPLPIPTVGKMLDDPDLSHAAECYLLSEDSPAARRFVRAHHPDQYLVFGGDPVWDAETRLMDEIRGADGPDEVYALFSYGGWGGNGDIIIRCYGDKAELVFCSKEELLTSRQLSKEERKDLMRFIAENNIDNLTHLPFRGIYDGIEYDYVHFTRKSGARVSMNNPDDDRMVGSCYKLLCLKMLKLRRTKGRVIHLPITKLRKDVKVLLADHVHPVQTVWKNGSDMRVLRLHDRKNLSKRKFKKGYEKGYFHWQKIENGSLGDVVAEPEACPVMTGDLTLQHFSGMVEPYWKENNSSKVTTLNGKWPLTVRTKISAKLAKENLLCRDPGVEINFPKDVEICPVCYIEVNKKVFICSRKSEEDYFSGEVEVTEKYFLLDPENGRLESVQGEFRPLFQITYRDLQPTGREGEAWAAIPNKNSSCMDVGRYDMKNFSFKPVTTLPRIQFDSMDMWVDESENSIYVVTNGCLLLIPFNEQ